MASGLGLAPQPSPNLITVRVSLTLLEGNERPGPWVVSLKDKVHRSRLNLDAIGMWWLFFVYFEEEQRHLDSQMPTLRIAESFAECLCSHVLLSDHCV